MILYFSATGNCKYVAEEIAKALDDRAVSILTTDTQELKDTCLGIICPTYAFGIPSVVEDFLRRQPITKQGNYLFFLATYGTTPGQSGYFAGKALQVASGVTFDACFSVKMPDTWTPMFDLSDEKKVAHITENVEPQLEYVIKAIRERQTGNRMQNRIPALARLIYRPYYNRMRRTKKISLENNCIGCGLCAQKCPVAAIKMVDGKPVWTKNQCVMCLGCLHRSPKFAIQYGRNTKKHGQYKNPHVTV